MKKLLMVAFHYPPATGSSGLLRSLAFSTYLPAHGWQPVVLSASPSAHERLDQALLAKIPPSVEIERAFARDAARHLAVRGRYLKATALPDRWVSWWLGAVPAGLRLIARHRPAAIWSTYPVATAHLIGLTLHRLTGVPWVADFRDPMVQPDYPTDPLAYRAFEQVERRTVRRAARVVFTTPGARRMYAERYPALPAERWAVIPNGYDEDLFAAAEGAALGQQKPTGRFVLLHSGALYPSERDPSALFGALADLKRAGRLDATSFALVLRATGHDDTHRALLREHGVEDLVTLAPHVPYREALAEMFTADALLLLQASNCNDQVPAKLYEYLRVRRPVLALTDARGDTAATLRGAGIDTILPLDSRGEIARGLPAFIDRVRAGSAPLASDAEITANTRQGRTAELAKLLDAVVSGRGVAGAGRR